jgi:hypothetical protein
MSTAALTEGITKTPPGFNGPDLRTLSFRVPGFIAPWFGAKTASVLSLLGVLTAAFAEILFRDRLNVSGSLIVVLAMIAVALPFYTTLSPLKRRLSLLAACFNLAGLALEVLRLQPHGVNIAIVFNGFYCVLIGYLVFSLSHVHRVVGALMALGGLGWLTFLSSPVANYLSPFNLAFGLLGEGLVCLWLVIGVDVPRWKEQASATRGRRREPSSAADTSSRTSWKSETKF